MRFYGTVKTERASKSQGGNDHVAFDLTYNDVPVISLFARVVLNNGNVEIVVDDLTNGTRNAIVLLDQVLKTKGEKQKGTNCKDCYAIDPTGGTDCPRHRK